MSYGKLRVDVQLSPDEKTATIRFGSRCPCVADCLGVERNEAGEIERIYLAQKVHKAVQKYDFSEWTPKGAYTTILVRTG